jgi:hypothetical protein
MIIEPVTFSMINNFIINNKAILIKETRVGRHDMS